MLLQRCRLVIRRKLVGMHNKIATLLQFLYGLPMKCYFDAMALKGFIFQDEVRLHSAKFSGHLTVNFYIPR